MCEVPGWGLQLPPGRVLAEMAALGIQATELGAIGWIPFEPDRIRETLAGHGLDLLAGFVPIRVGGDEDAAAKELEPVLDVLAGAGAELAVLAAVGDRGFGPGSLPGRELRERLAGVLSRAAALAGARGLTHAVHPHAETLIEDAETIAWLAAETDVRWCLDTGHFAIAELDPASFVAEHSERVVHVHLKDVDSALAADVREHRLSLLEATRRGLFRPLGDGDAPIEAALAGLEAAGYDAWFVLEQDVTLAADPPPSRGPVEDVRRSLEYLDRHAVGAVR